MSKQCEICGKKPQVGNMVSHSQRKTKRRFLPNIQNATVDNKKVKICTNCIKTLAKV